MPMIHMMRIVAGCVLRNIFEEWGLLRNESCPMSPLLVIFLTSIELKLPTTWLVCSINVLPSNIRSLMSPELKARVAIVLNPISHWAMPAFAAIPMSCPSRRDWRWGWRWGWRALVVWHG